MKTILIPVDFSETSTNALKYTTALIKDIDVGRIILLKNFYKSVYEQVLPSADFIQLSEEDIQQEKNLINQQLESLTQHILKKCHPSIQVKTVISELPLLRSIQEITAREKPDLLIVGSDSPYEEQQSYIGEQVIGIAKTSKIPVLIIPPNAVYEKITTALVPCDFETVSRLHILKGLHSPLDWLQPELMVLNIDPKQKHIAHEDEHQNALTAVLGDYTYKIYYTADKDTVSGILNFAKNHNVKLITALPGKYSFFYTLTHQSTTEALALNSHEPILILK